jgi:hypothetical protein
MAFLKLNNWSIDIAQADEQVLEIGNQNRAFSGKLRKTRRAVKRQWSFTTSPMLYDDALALEGMLMALGEQWQGETDVFSAKGLTWYQDNGISTVIGVGKYGNAWWPRGPTVNLFTTNVATGTDTSANATGFDVARINNGYDAVAFDGTVVSSTAQYLSGTRSAYVDLDWINSGVFGGVRAQAAVLPNTQYTFSCYVRGDPTTGIALVTVVWGNGNGITDNGKVNGGNSSSAWQRWTYTFTTNSTCTSVRCMIGENLNGGYNFWTDQWQLELGAAASPWSSGFTGVNIAYDIGKHVIDNPEALSISGWGINPAIDGTFALITQPSGSGYMRVYYSAANTMRLRIASDTGATTDVSAAWATPATYALWTAVILRSPQATPNMLLYRNGALVASGTAPAIPSFATMSRFYLGNSNGTNQWFGLIDELMLYPFTPVAGMLQALSAQTTTPSRQPAVLAQGDFNANQPVSVIASDVRTSFLAAGTKGSWRSNLAKVQFTLSEV